jgi:hypothetical protein
MDTDKVFAVCRVCGIDEYLPFSTVEINPVPYMASLQIFSTPNPRPLTPIFLFEERVKLAGLLFPKEVKNMSHAQMRQNSLNIVRNL